MTRASYLLIGVAPIALLSAAVAHAAPADPVDQVASGAAAKVVAKAEEVFSTGVAKGRDRLDSATSTSAIKESEVQKLGGRSLADILRNIPGVRTESSTGNGNSNYTIRGLPMAAGGSKFMQIEEDGLPVLEFGDIYNVASDVFIRADFNLSQIEAIRGGSASTFASNSPGGVINLISKTGEVEGGAIQATVGLDYGEHRLDFDYGGKLTDTLRYHIGGFYRIGEGPRELGYNGFKGGQLKFNVTKTFDGGLLRLYAKYLDDRSPQYQLDPIRITGTADKPHFASFANMDVKRDTLMSANIPSAITLDGNNQPSHDPLSDGMHALVKAVGLEAQFEIGGWSFSDRARYSNNSGSVVRDLISSVNTAAALATTLGGAGATLSYASGPLTGQAISNPATLGGNGLLISALIPEVKIHSLNNFTNDLRTNRVWKLGAGDLTFTAGVYNAAQKINTDWLYTNIVQDAVGNGRSSLINVTNAAGVAQTQEGFVSFNLNGTSGTYRRTFDVDYSITAPYGSVNYHIGKLALGGSVRYDIGRVRGNLFGSDLGGGRIGLTSYDFNGDGKISVAESKTGTIPITRPAPVNYNYHYVSYSVGANFRIAEPLSVFARYSRGGRANADKILFTSAVNMNDGSLAKPSDAYDAVRQAEAGLKFRKSGVTINLTSFLANAVDHNIQNGTGLQLLRAYRAYGAELEAGFRHGPFSVAAGATYTHAEIVDDPLNPAINGNVPRHQPKFIFELTPQYETRLFTVGANVIGNTSSFAQDVGGLKMPGYTVVNGFVQFRPVDRVQIMINANNLFDTTAFLEVAQSAVPANGIGWGRTMNGRTVSASLKLSF